MSLLSAPQKITELVLQEQFETHLGSIYIYDTVIMMEAREDVTVSFGTGMYILLKLLTKIGTRSVVYISHRINSYAVDPNDYKYLEMIPNLKGIAVVSYSESRRSTARSLEKKFYKKPFETFENLQDASSWATEILAQ